jgi:ribosomal protein L31E
MAKEKTNALKRICNPSRARCRIVPRYKKANKAVKTVKEFLANI